MTPRHHLVRDPQRQQQAAGARGLLPQGRHLPLGPKAVPGASADGGGREREPDLRLGAAAEAPRTAGEVRGAGPGSAARERRLRAPEQLQEVPPFLSGRVPARLPPQRSHGLPQQEPSKAEDWTQKRRSPSQVFLRGAQRLRGLPGRWMSRQTLESDGFCGRNIESDGGALGGCYMAKYDKHRKRTGNKVSDKRHFAKSP
nr:uncharacterized protein LOC113813660 [Penaeus vannamei]